MSSEQSPFAAEFPAPPLLHMTSPDPRQALPDWVAAFNAADLDAITALYDPQAVLWGTLAPALISTPLAIRQYFERVFAALPPPQVQQGDGGLLRLYGDVALHAGSYALTVGRPDGEVLRLPARFSFTYRRASEGGPWLIIDHHSSALPAPAQPG